MHTIVTASTGARIEVWREGELFHARVAERAGQPEVCIGMDLFEVIADLAGLKLEDETESAEATRLASEAQQRLGALITPGTATEVTDKRRSGAITPE